MLGNKCSFSLFQHLCGRSKRHHPQATEVSDRNVDKIHGDIAVGAQDQQLQ